ncbi:MAG: glucokinase, partial [Woeseiaceae bacterium]
MATDLRADTSWLIADIGATSTRCATCCASSRRIDELKIFQNEQFDSLDGLLGSYLSSVGTKPAAAALAIAGPIDGDDIQMTNRNWQFNRRELAERLRLEPLI